MRILIATVTAGGGHLAAASALEEAWRGARPEDQVQRVDLMEFVPRLQKKLYAEGFVKFVEHAPEMWALAYKKTDNPELIHKLSRFRRALAGNTNLKFVKLLREFSPQAVLCTHYLPLEVIGYLKAKATLPIPYTVSVVTDFEAHALWMEECVNLYCVAAEETKARLVARGASANNILATGIPISPRFSQPIEAASIRKTYGLRDDLPVLLVLSGGFGMGPVGEILARLDQCEQSFQTVVVAGRNVELRRELAVQDRRHPTHVLGFVNNMHELMTIASLIITKPGGLTSSEALAKGKPMVIINPIPGQEAANSDFLLERGAAIKLNRLDDLPYRMSHLLDSNKLAEMAKAATALGKPQAAHTICREIIERLNVVNA